MKNNLKKVNRFTQIAIEGPSRRLLKDKYHVSHYESDGIAGCPGYGRTTFPMLNDCSVSLALHVIDISV